jgi:hypothetical protein
VGTGWRKRFNGTIEVEIELLTNQLRRMATSRIIAELLEDRLSNLAGLAKVSADVALQLEVKSQNLNGANRSLRYARRT